MDTSSTPTGSESSDTSSLTTEQAGAAFAALIDAPAEIPEKDRAAPETPEAKPEADPNAQDEGADPELTADEAAETVTVEIDGKPVEMTKAQIAEAYKAGLRQADYTKKTQEISEQRKAADAETARAREERATYTRELQRQTALLEATLHEQQQTDWNALLEQDPVEYLKQQHLFQRRQAALQETYQRAQQVEQQTRAEQESGFRQHIEAQREQLLAKVPEWKDEAKMKAGTAAVKDYLLKSGYSESEIASVHDHRAVLNVRKAMLYDEMMAKASAAAKKVAAAPQRVERPAGGASQGLDRRQVAFQRLSKTGSVEAAGQVFAGLI